MSSMSKGGFRFTQVWIELSSVRLLYNGGGGHHGQEDSIVNCRTDWCGIDSERFDQPKQFISTFCWGKMLRMEQETCETHTLTLDEHE